MLLYKMNKIRNILITIILLVSSFLSAQCVDDPTGIFGPGCANVTTWVGCDGSFNGTDDIPYLVANICTVSCESCSSGPTGCDLPDMSLSILDDGTVL